MEDIDDRFKEVQFEIGDHIKLEKLNEVIVGIIGVLNTSIDNKHCYEYAIDDEFMIPADCLSCYDIQYVCCDLQIDLIFMK